MKLLQAAAIAIIYAQAALSAPADVVSVQADANGECGSLGVMKVDNATLPANVDRNNIRKCAGHPEGLGEGQTRAATAGQVVASTGSGAGQLTIGATVRGRLATLLGIVFQDMKAWLVAKVTARNAEEPELDFDTGVKVVQGTKGWPRRRTRIVESKQRS
ncbi:hypothetical protein MAC_08675 [Metarhizium acridum CQMa 102]|uniref:Uncharacterized protein n=1 Tax=Metarhizium acridum (strain CQMa 102) TaxID=655827 RepID=E9EFM8_METAQ|nr:uncharacterized protein MAC_08675 [Metarhizium acridum CQMa 102]EFY85266.1 hypothetical protein MAC_08675 [Metarhizium acridum CQMa 102]